MIHGNGKRLIILKNKKAWGLIIITNTVVHSFWPQKILVIENLHGIYVFYITCRGRFTGMHFLIFILKLLGESNYFFSFRTRSQIFNPR